MPLSELPLPLLASVFSFCSAADLARCKCAAKCLGPAVDKAAAVSSKKVSERFYPTLDNDWSFSTPLETFRQLTAEHIIVVRGFITYSFDVHSQVWKRCHDTRRDRGHFNSLFFRGEIYALGTYSVVAAGTVERYCPFRDYWSTVASMPNKLRSVGGFVLDEQLYLCGGIAS
eukprot:CAMPEP_0173318498 /NCGR_PEP_ID=MMETSP1143-20121109/27690_1 /TAXON_ID=483371 /ORGANISM="non described non described, Strain CCMP2298" /LENGTH=171 /DNA_ID=CAMNT_0014261749 /DNA_START=78 /DNA_END=589 /DNA_ORIENTATION=+